MKNIPPYFFIGSVMVLLALLAGGCTRSSFSALPAEQNENVCRTDSDCIRAGCSGTVCQPKNAEPVFTTCEYLPEYACYEKTSCGCVQGQCAWKATGKFEQCLEENREKPAAPAVDEEGVPIA